jgi:hypothetical protein
MRTAWPALPIVVLATWACSMGSGSRADEIVLVREGEPAATIVLASRPSRASQLAAFELQEHVRLITGARLPIVDESAVVTGTPIYVGPSRDAGPPLDFAAEEYAVIIRPGGIVLAGQDAPGDGRVRYWLEGVPGAYDYLTWPGMFESKGTLHAAYDFLERSCGVRWFNQGELGTDVPVSKTLAVAPREVRRSPAFRFRDAGYLPVTMDRYDNEGSLWTVRWSEPTPRFERWLGMLYERGRRQPECDHPHRWLDYRRSHVFAFLTRRRLGGEPFKTNHSFYGWYDRFWRPNPAAEAAFVERRPDWFAQGYPDDQLPPQLCYSNPEVLAQCLADARAFFALPEAARRDAALGTDRFFPVVPMDNTSFCKCPRCLRQGPAERVHPEFSNGDHSERVWSFVNAVADGLAESHPDVTVSALAYSTYARRPPGMRIAPNVAVQLSLFPQAVVTDPVQAATDEAMVEEWADGRPLYLWLYGGLTTGHKPAVPMFPQQMLGVYPHLLRRYRAAGARGLFCNGIPQETDAYFLFCLVDDPDQDPDALAADYFARMYGPEAGATIREFHERLASTYAEARRAPRGVSGPELHYGLVGTAARIKELAGLVERAERQLASAPEPWRKRFELLRFGTWEYIAAGRAAYEAAKVVKASEPVALFCPLVGRPVGAAQQDEIDWSDAQQFGGFNGWLRDDGDLSLRKIESWMAHDGRRLYLRFREADPDPAPAAGDAWEIVFRQPGTGPVYRLTVAHDGGLSGQVLNAGGAPQDWGRHGATAVSDRAGGSWTVTVAVPLAALPGDPAAGVVMNCRRRDRRGEDSPVFVATGNDFESGSTGGILTCDGPRPGAAALPPAADLLLDWDLAAAGGALRDRSGHGNHGVLGGAAQPGPDGIELTGGGQYLELPAVRGRDPASYSINCWFRYPDADRLGHLLLLSQGSFEVRLGVPHRRLGFLHEPPGGPAAGAGPVGVELGPGSWHMLTLVRAGDNLVVYENGRPRETLSAGLFQPPASTGFPWRFGGGPKRPPHYSLLGMLGEVQVYGRDLTAAEVMAIYEKDRQPRIMSQ